MTRAGRWGAIGTGALFAFSLSTAARHLGSGPDTHATVASVSAGIAFFEARWSGDPRDYLAGRQLLRRYVERFGLAADLDDLTRAEAVARGVVPIAPEPARSWAALSSVLLMQHEFVPALDAARRAVAVDSTNAEALGVLADASLAAGDYGRAEAALRLLPGGATGTLSRWASYLELGGRSEEAARLIERVCRALERARASSVSRAWCLTQWGRIESAARLDGATARFQQALVVQPGYGGALEGLADLAFSAGRDEEAARLYRRIASDAHPDLYLRLADLASRRDRPGEAETWRSKFARAALRPDREALHGPAIVQFHLEAGHPDSALAVARREVARRPTVESWDLLSWVLHLAGQPEKGLAAAERAGSWGKPTPTMKYHRGRILEALDDPRGPALVTEALGEWDRLEPHARSDARRRAAVAAESAAE